MKYYCKKCLLSICEKCKDYHYENPHELIELDSIEIDNMKLNVIMIRIDPNNQNNLMNELNYLNIKENLQNKNLNPKKK